MELQPPGFHVHSPSHDSTWPLPKVKHIQPEQQAVQGCFARSRHLILGGLSEVSSSGGMAAGAKLSRSRRTPILQPTPSLEAKQKADFGLVFPEHPLAAL